MHSSILVPVDLEVLSSRAKALPTALAMAKCFKARLTLATVVGDKAAREAQWSSIGYRELLSAASARLGLLADQLCGDTSIETRVGTGSISGGANASLVVRHARCSVLVVRE